MPHLISFLSGLSRRLLSRTKTFSSCEKYRQLSFEYGGPGGGLRPHGTTVGKRWVEERSFIILPWRADVLLHAGAAHFAAEALPQLSQHFFQQAEEEKGHALRLIKYVVDAGGRVVIPAIDAPKSKFKTARDAVKLSLDQEIHVTQQINGLVGLARKQNDYITINF